jgi:hypothetical protein
MAEQRQQPDPRPAGVPAQAQCPSLHPWLTSAYLVSRKQLFHIDRFGPAAGWSWRETWEAHTARCPPSGQQWVLLDPYLSTAGRW